MRPAIRFGSRASLGRRSGRGRAGACSCGFGGARGAARRWIWRGLLFSEAETAAVNFLDIAAALQLLDHARKKTPAAVLQFHAVRDLADAGRLRQLGEIGDYISGGDFGGVRFFFFGGVLASHECSNWFPNRLTELRVSSKGRGRSPPEIGAAGKQLPYENVSVLGSCRWAACRQEFAPGIRRGGCSYNTTAR